MPGNGLTSKDITRVLRRIEREVRTAEEEGLDGPGCWYALDRLAMIRDVCDRALAGDRLACVVGFGSEDEEAAAFFDREA